MDWQPGDLALCLGDDDPWFPPEPCDPRPGMVLTVRSYSPHDDGLWFVGVQSCDSYKARYFRRIPPHTPDAEDAETIRLLNDIPMPKEA